MASNPTQITSSPSTPLSRVVLTLPNPVAPTVGHCRQVSHHCNDVTKSAMVSQITCVSIVYWTVCSGAGQREHQSSASWAFCEGGSLMIGKFSAQRPVTRQMSPFDDVNMIGHQIVFSMTEHINGLAKSCNKCSSLTMELLQSCRKPSI